MIEKRRKIKRKEKKNNMNENDKKDWIKELNEERKKAYKLIDETALKVVKNVENYKVFLDVQSRFDMYSVGNALLITSQKPDATKLKTYNEWKQYGTVYKNYTKIKILEPKKYYSKDNFNAVNTWNPKNMIDISDTSLKDTLEKQEKYNDKIKLAALLSECPVDIKVVSEIPDYDVYAKWDDNENILYVKSSENINSVFQSLVKELARSSIETSNNSELDNFKCESVAYLVCKKCNIDTSLIKVNTIPEILQNMYSKEVRAELTKINSTMKEINDRMEDYYEKQEKENNKEKTNRGKDYER